MFVHRVLGVLQEGILFIFSRAVLVLLAGALGGEGLPGSSRDDSSLGC